MRNILCWISCLGVIGCVYTAVLGQNVTLEDSIQFVVDGKTLSSPYAGGLNLPQLSPFNFNNDTLEDLLVFDRDGSRVLAFINTGNDFPATYLYDESYSALFPKMKNYCLARDIDCDGRKDLFTGYQGGLMLYKNTSSGGTLSFSLLTNKVMTDPGQGPEEIIVGDIDLPAIDDIDGDGDLDILTFDGTGSSLELHTNQAVENGDCSQFSFVVTAPCWGDFFETETTNQVILNISCKGATGATTDRTNVHAGSTVCSFDQNYDGDKEVLLGDLFAHELVYLRNSGDSLVAHIDTAAYGFPHYDETADLAQFLASFYLDLDNDGKKDLIVAPNAANISFNYKNVWMYKNVGSDQVIFNLQNKFYLQDDMIDCGAVSFPAFFDHNADGLLDLIVGNENYYSESEEYSGLTLFENTGTASSPQFELVSRDYMGLSGMFSPAIENLRPTMGDLDADGDIDILVGDDDGRIHWIENTAGPGNLADLVLGVYKFMDIDETPGSTPFLVDLNRDGKLDIVMGEVGGKLLYFENTGTPEVPFFDAEPTIENFGGVDVQPNCCTGYSVPWVYESPAGNYELFVGAENGRIFKYGNIDGNLNGNFTLLDTFFRKIEVGQRAAIAMADLDGDDKLSYVVGNSRGGLSFYEDDITANQSSLVEVKSPFHIFPNPAQTKQLTLELPFQLKQDVELSIFSVQGVKMFHSVLARGSSKVQLEVGPLSSGIYFVQIPGFPTQKWVLTTK